MRDAFGYELVEVGTRVPTLMVVDGDNAPATRLSGFARAYPERFVNVGCAEQNMVGFSAGLALAGHSVVVSTFAVFLCGRALEQIRSSVCRDRLSVTLVGTHAGITVGRDGASHFAVEDIACMRALPEMCVLVASSNEQVGSLLSLAVARRAPTYLRISRHSSPASHANCEHEIGGAALVRSGTDVSIFACGLMVARASAAALLLSAEGVDAEVIDLYSVKPIAERHIAKSAAKTGAVVVVEEHSVHGGLGDAVASCIGQHSSGVPIEQLGIPDTFARSGGAEELLDLVGLTAENIATAGIRAISRRE